MSGQARFSLSLAKATVYTSAGTATPERRARFDKGVALFRDLCTGPDRTRAERYAAVAALLKAVPTEGVDVVKYWLDALPFLPEAARSETLDLLDDLLDCPALSSHDKLTIAVTQYNGCFLDRCYASFRKLLADTAVVIEHRIEASRYLFATRRPDLQAVALEFLLGVVGSLAYPSEWRYRTLMGFASRSGVKTYMNCAKLAIDYDEDFVYWLQHAFFHEPQNGLRERILSGQYLLGMRRTPADVRASVEAALLKVAADAALDDNVRADAADVLARAGAPETQTQAQSILTALGLSAVPTKERTVYTDKQNIHNVEVGKSAEEFIETIARNRQYLKRAKPYAVVRTELAELVRRSNLSKDDRLACFKSLNRIDIDAAQYGKYKLTAADILAYVWDRVQRHEAREELERRLVNELVEMTETCGTGHEIRPINALSGFEGYINVIRIPFAEQIKANVVGRMNARIREIGDEKLLDQVVTAQLADASPEAKRAYAEYVAAELADLRAELFDEFVGDGHVIEEEFAAFFAEGAAKFELAPANTADNSGRRRANS